MTTTVEQLCSLYVGEYPADVLQLINQGLATAEDVIGTGDDDLVRLLERASPEITHNLINLVDTRRKMDLLQRCSVRKTLQILGSLSEEERDQFLAELPPVTRTELEKIRQFPEQMAGHYMESVGTQFHTGETIAEALTRLRESKVHRIRSIYVIDEQNRLAGRVDLQDMALSDQTRKLSTLMNPVEGFASLTTPRDELVEIFNDYRLDSIPLVDEDHALIGVVRYGSLFQAAEESLTGDLQMMVGVSPEERALSSPWFAVRKRLPWLHINLLTAFLAASVVGFFESIIAQFTALAILLPVVAGQSGNAGSQALAVTMRGLALREISLMKWRQVLSKEVQIGIVDGLALALTCGLGVFVWSQSVGLAVVIGIAMVISMVAAGISGALVPMVLIRLGQDPATASSIILTTVTDVAGFISFLGTATLLAGYI